MGLRIVLVILTAIVQIALSYVEIMNGNIPQRYRDLPARFGPQLPMEGLTGYLIPIRYLLPDGPETGCKPVNIPSNDIQSLIKATLKLKAPLPANATIPWIVLVERGDCKFDEKVLAMQQSGAAGVIVGNNVFGELKEMEANDDQIAAEITVPSVFVSHWDYLTLIALSLDESGQLKKVMVRIIEPMKQAEIPMMFLLAIAVFLFAVALIRARYENDTDNNGLRNIFGYDPAPLAVVNALATKMFRKSKLEENEPDICGICLEDFVDGDLLRKLPCKHEFHKACVDPWLLSRKKLCPICRTSVCPQVAKSSFFSQFTGAHSNDERQPLLHEILTNTPIAPPIQSPSPGFIARTASPFSGSVGSAASSVGSIILSLRRGSDSPSLLPNVNVVVADEHDYEECRQLAFSQRRHHH